MKESICGAQVGKLADESRCFGVIARESIPLACNTARIPRS